MKNRIMEKSKQNRVLLERGLRKNMKEDSPEEGIYIE